MLDRGVLAIGWAVREPYTGNRRVVAGLVAGLWLAAAILVGGLLLWYHALCACSHPPSPPEATYLGLTATVVHLAGVYLGGALLTVAVFSRRFGPGA